MLAGKGVFSALPDLSDRELLPALRQGDRDVDVTLEQGFRGGAKQRAPLASA